MKADRATFKMQSYWTALIAVAMFTAAYAPDTLRGKLFCLGAVWVVSMLVFIRSSVANMLSDKQTTVSDTVVERVLMTMIMFVTLGTVYFAEGDTLREMLTCLAACAVATVASARAHDRSERDVNPTQLGVFHTAPVLVAIALPAAYMAGVSVWFVIGFAAVTAVAHMFYAYQLDEIEKRPSNVVPLHAISDVSSESDASA